MSSQESLFDRSEFERTNAPAEANAVGGTPRLRHAVRDQYIMLPGTIDDLLAADHQARLVWKFVCGLDLSPLLSQIEAVEGRVGRSATDPRILLTLWLYATIEGVGSARALDRLCETHATYRWITGGVSLNYHTLSDFRTQHETFLDQMLTNSVATLMHAGVVELRQVAQDGMRVRASAGQSSFRRQQKLEDCLRQARQQVAALKAELDADPAAGSARERAARERATAERAARVEQALEELAKLDAAKTPKDREKTKVSTTDPPARVMKMGDGGFRPAYNVQFAVDTTTQVIVGFDVTTRGTDKGEMLRMHQQVVERYQRTPQRWLADGDFAVRTDIERLHAAGTIAYTPPKKPHNLKRELDAPRPDDSAVLQEWRQRMGTPEAQSIYRQRASSVECVNAHARNRNLKQFTVRGLAKVRAVVLWQALAQNILRTLKLLRLAAAQTPAT
jgi:transposase